MGTYAELEVFMATRIVFNGKTYTDPSEMSPDVRTLYDRAMAMLADADANGVPDVLERAGTGNVIAVHDTRLIVNGKEYADATQMPADVRRLYDMAITQAGGLGLGGAGAPRLGGEVGRPVHSGAPSGFNLGGALLLALMAALGAALVFWLV